MITRRVLLQTGGMVAIAAGVAAQGFVSRVAEAATASRSGRKVLVVVYQRFGMDGLIAVAPYANESLRKLRPDLLLPAPDSGKEGALVDLGGGYGLNPWLSALAPLYREGNLAFVQAAGSPDNTRSHLDAAQWWESGTPGNKSTPDGWLNRAVTAAGPDSARALRAASLTTEQPRALYGKEQTVSMTDLSHLQFGTSRSDEQLRAIEAAYANSGNAALRQSAAQGFELARALAGTRPRDAAGYPDTLFGNNMRDIAALIKADVGLQVAFAESRSGTGGKGLVGHPHAGARRARAILLPCHRRRLLQESRRVLERSGRAPRRRGAGHAHRFRPQRRAERGARLRSRPCHHDVRAGCAHSRRSHLRPAAGTIRPRRARGSDRPARHHGLSLRARGTCGRSTRHSARTRQPGVPRLEWTASRARARLNRNNKHVFHEMDRRGTRLRLRAPPGSRDDPKCASRPPRSKSRSTR